MLNACTTGNAVFQVSFLPCRGSGSTTSSGDPDFDGEYSPEHRRLQRTPTPYYEEAPSLPAADTLNVDDMDATDSLDDSVTEMSGTTDVAAVRKEVSFFYDGDEDDDDDDEKDICRELAQLN